MTDAARPRRRRLLLLLLAVVLLAAGLTAWVSRSRIALHLGQRALADLEFDDADGWAGWILARDPDWNEGLLLAARAAAGLRDHQRAFRLLEKIPDDGSVTAIAARCAAGDLLIERLHRMSAAEEQFQRARRQSPEDHIANDRLSYLLGVASRRWESIGPRITICRQDNFDPLHLKLLALGETSLVEPEIVLRFHKGDPDDPAPRISLARIALGDQDLEQAIAWLREAVGTDPGLAEAQSLLGAVLLQAGDDQGFLDWHQALPGSADDHPGIWNARGRFATSRDQPLIAARCFWEAVSRDPNYHQANYQLGQVLTRLGRARDAAAFLERSRMINRYTTRVTAAWATERLSDLEIVVDLAERLGLIWEAYGWSRWVIQKDDTLEWAQQASDRLQGRLAGLEPVRTQATANPAGRVNLGNLPLPDWGLATATASDTIDLAGVDVRFEDQATAAGLTFSYNNGGSPDSIVPGYMYEMTGGGAAVLDFDGDGWPDVYLPQGGDFARRGRADNVRDRLFRNTAAGGFLDVTRQAGLVGTGFGQGATVGDFDGDGFPDLVVANIGGNRLLRNNGDGTFSNITALAGIAGDRWTTSCLLVDLNGDGLTDLYAANFLAGDVLTHGCNRIRGPELAEAVDKKSRGKPGTMRSGVCSPLDFPAAQDQLYLNSGDGRFREITAESGITVPRGNGLGIVAADFSGSGHLNLFLANDSVPNFFFVHQGTGPDGVPRFENQALYLGLAVNQDGSAEACMGVACGDADGDGRIDLYVTNFLNQSNTLYRKLPRQESFLDVTQQSGLHENSMSLLGFGTQFLDANLDGHLDLVITNGHVGDFPDHQTLYQMPNQYLHNLGNGTFVELKSDRLGGFFDEKMLGRGLVRLDWNRDGLDDAVISSTDVPVALLTCTSPRHGHYVALRLRATGTARDAIGTSVTLKVADRSLTRQQTAGDGYMASNQRQLVFGTGDVKAVGPLEVRWPSGRVDTFQSVPIDCELFLVEGRRVLWRVPR